VVIQTQTLKRHFLKNEVSPSPQGKQWTVFVVSDKIQTLNHNQNFENLYNASLTLTASQ